VAKPRPGTPPAPTPAEHAGAMLSQHEESALIALHRIEQYAEAARGGILDGTPNAAHAAQIATDALLVIADIAALVAIRDIARRAAPAPAAARAAA
jgi:hypothetical protein